MTRALVRDGRVNIFVATTTNLVAHAQEIHGLWPTSTAALGRLLSMGVIMGTQLKNGDDVLTLSVDGDGPLKKVIVQARNDGSVRGYVSNKEVMMIKDDLYKLDVSKAIGQGTLSVARDYGLKGEYASSIELISGEIGEDFAYYFSQSEQIPSAVSVGVLVTPEGDVESAGALLIQLLPDHIEDDILVVEDIIRNLKPMSSLVKEGYTSLSLIEALFDDVSVVESKDVYFKCDCDFHQMERVLLTLSKEELESLIEEDESVTLECHYCSEQYTFNRTDIEVLIKS